MDSNMVRIVCAALAAVFLGVIVLRMTKPNVARPFKTPLYPIMPLIGIKNELMSKQLQIIPVKGFPVKSTWYMIWLKDKKLSPVSAALLAYIKKEKQNIIHERFEWFERY